MKRKVQRDRAVRPVDLGIQFHGEVMAGDVHALAKVEPVGSEEGDAGVEMELIAFFGSGMIDEPIEELIAVAF